MSRRLFPGRIAEEIAGEDRSRVERLKLLARELVGVVREGLIRDGQVRIHGFGTFRLSPTRARKGINPRTGERIDIPARNRVLFRPAKALRERIEPGAAPAVPLAEPHASREAALGGVMSETPAAGAVPATDEDGQRPGYFPDRIAAAAISDTVVRTTGEPPTAGSGSREANLGGKMGDSPSAGRVPVISPVSADESPPAIEPGAGATVANEEHERGSREATLGGTAAASPRTAGSLPSEDLPPDEQEADRPATVPVTRGGPGPLDTAPDEAGVVLPKGASREAGLSGKAAVPPAGGLPAEEEDTGDAPSGFEAEAPLREDTGAEAREEAVPGTGGSRESSLADGEVVARPAGGLPDEDLPWDAETEDAPRPGTVPVTARGPSRRDMPPPAETAGSLRPDGSREAGLGGGRSESGPAAGALPEEEATQSEAIEPVAPESQPVRQRIVIDDDVESGRVAAPESAETRAERSRWPLLLLLLALLIAALAWWFWPRVETPSVTQPTESGAVEETEPTDTPATAGAEGDTATEVTETPATAAVEGETVTEPTNITGAAEAEEGAATETAAAEETTQAGSVEEVVEAPAEEAATAAVLDEPLDPTRTDTAASVTGEDSATATDETAAPAESEGVEEVPATASVQAEEAPVAGAETTAAAETGTSWFSGRDYSVQRGDTLWDLSGEHYVNPYYWPHIWNHNETLANPDVVEIDQSLWLPTLQGEPRSLTAADRRSIAEGYLRLYRLWVETGAANPQYALVGVRFFDPSVMPSELRNDPSAGRPGDTLAAAFEAQLQAAFPRRQ